MSTPSIQKKLNTHSDADEISAYIHGNRTELSPALQRKLKRMESAAELVRKYGSRQKVATMLQKLGTYVEMGSKSQATAYRDIDDAIEVFGTQYRKAKDFYVDVLFEQMFSTRAKAEAAQDLKALVACEKNIATAIKDFLGDKELIDWSKIQPPRILLGYFPEILNIPLPEPAVLEAQIQKLLQSKRGKNLSVNDAEDAQIVP